MHFEIYDIPEYSEASKLRQYNLKHQRNTILASISYNNDQLFQYMKEWLIHVHISHSLTHYLNGTEEFLALPRLDSLNLDLAKIVNFDSRYRSISKDMQESCKEFIDLLTNKSNILATKNGVGELFLFTSPLPTWDEVIKSLNEDLKLKSWYLIRKDQNVSLISYSVIEDNLHSF